MSVNEMVAVKVFAWSNLDKLVVSTFTFEIAVSTYNFEVK
jgi:hypothetical protein